MKGYLWQTKKIPIPGFKNAYAIIRELKQKEADKADSAKMTVPVKKKGRPEEVTFITDPMKKNRLLLGYSLFPIPGCEDVGLYVDGEKIPISPENGFSNLYDSIPERVGRLLLEQIHDLNEFEDEKTKTKTETNTADESFEENDKNSIPLEEKTDDAKNSERE